MKSYAQSIEDEVGKPLAWVTGQQSLAPQANLGRALRELAAQGHANLIAIGAAKLRYKTQGRSWLIYANTGQTPPSGRPVVCWPAAD